MGHTSNRACQHRVEHTDIARAPALVGKNAVNIHAHGECEQRDNRICDCDNHPVEPGDQTKNRTFGERFHTPHRLDDTARDGAITPRDCVCTCDGKCETRDDNAERITLHPAIQSGRIVRGGGARENERARDTHGKNQCDRRGEDVDGARYMPELDDSEVANNGESECGEEEREVLGGFGEGFEVYAPIRKRQVKVHMCAVVSV